MGTVVVAKVPGKGLAKTRESEWSHHLGGSMCGVGQQRALRPYGDMCRCCQKAKVSGTQITRRKRQMTSEGGGSQDAHQAALWTISGTLAFSLSEKGRHHRALERRGEEGEATYNLTK